MASSIKPTVSTSKGSEYDFMSLSTDEASDDDDEECAEINHGLKLETTAHNKTLLHTNRWVKPM